MLTHINPAHLPHALGALRPKIESGWAGAFHIDGTDADLVLSVGVTKDSDQIALWVEALEGTVGFRPKRNLELMRDVLEDCEDKARQLGCTEMRIETEKRDDWQKALLPMFAFEPKTVGGKMIYRKALQ